MGELTFIHAADIHLGRPFSGLRKSDPELAQLFLSAGYQAWDRLVAVAIDLKVHFVTLGGDTFDAAYPTIRARVAFRGGIERLHSAGIPTFMALGNHDPLDGFPDTLRALPGLQIFKEEAEGKPVRRLEFTQGVVVFGASFVKPDVSDNLVRNFRRDPGIDVAIGLVHANVAGVGGHKNYAPCSLDDLVVAGMDAWCLGHVHSGGIFREDPLILYSGAAQGSHVNESGPKGCYLITIGPQAEASARFLPLGPVLWDTLDIDVSHISGPDDFLGIAEEACSRLTRSVPNLKAAVARINLQGSPAVSVSEMVAGEARELLGERLADLHVPVFLDSVSDLTVDSLDLDALVKEEGFLAEFLRICHRFQSDPAMIEELSAEIYADLSRKVPSRYIADEIDPRRLARDPNPLAETVNKVARHVAHMFGRPKI
jgi:DNA repair exonuclease SbcCD nuclease subunit